jgi:hypothetical protein
VLVEAFGGCGAGGGGPVYAVGVWCEYEDVREAVAGSVAVVLRDTASAIGVSTRVASVYDGLKGAERWAG